MIGMRLILVGLLVVALFVNCKEAPGQSIADIQLKSGMKISSATRIFKKTYFLAGLKEGTVQIYGHDFVVDFAGTKLTGDGKGIGIHIFDAKNVTLKNANISRCLWGVVIERSQNVKLIDCKTSENSDLAAGTEIDESGTQPEDQWGGGILIRDSARCTVQNCVSQYQWDGIDVISCVDCDIKNSDFSYNGNWGVHFWNSSKNSFKNNRAIWCTTGSGKLFQALTGWQTYDSQAVGIDHNSNDNLIEGNDLRFGGDGIFIRANEGPQEPGSVVPPKNPSNRNILRNNDCSFSPNNAIEVDFVDGTVIEGNNCSNSNYGMWLGYSRNCIVRNNLCINDSHHAIEIENGRNDLIEQNIFGFEKERADSQLIYLRQNGRDKTPSGGYNFQNNLFYGAGTGLLLKDTTAAVRNCTLVTTSKSPRMVKSNSHAEIEEAGNHLLRELPTIKRKFEANKTTIATPGIDLTLNLPELDFSDLPPLVLVETLNPVVLQVRSFTQHTVKVAIPTDFWNEPTSRSFSIRAYDGKRWAILSSSLSVKRRAGSDRIGEVSPLVGGIGEELTVRGEGLFGGKFLLNGSGVASEKIRRNEFKLKLPEDILVSTRYNLIYEKRVGEELTRLGPVELKVDIPTEKMPHLLSVTFEPKRLRVGDLLRMTFTLRNNLSVPAKLTMKPASGYGYTEGQSAKELGIEELVGALHLRVTSDNTGKHNPGSWPYLFGFDRESLAPGQTITVTGTIKMQYTGKREFRVGLVAGGFHFIDDNAFRTKIEVVQ